MTFPERILCSAFHPGQRNGSQPATQSNDVVKEANGAVFWSGSGDGHIASHSLAFYSPMSSLLTTGTVTFFASRKHGSLERRYRSRCSQLVSPRITPTETNIFLVRSGAGAYALWLKNNIQELKSFCSPDLEFLTIKCRPHYLPREFSSIIITAVYIPPQADTLMALNELYLTLCKLETTS